MKITEYIEELETLRKEHGEIEVEKFTFSRRVPAPSPRVAYRRVLGGIEIRSGYWEKHQDEKHKGKKVVQI